jgi:hypothetical protein
MTRTTVFTAAAGAVVMAAGAAVGQATHLNDDFDCYQPGDAISTLAAWELWPGAEEAYISDEQAFSGANSLHLDRAGADVVHQFSGYGGKRITYRAMTYVPSDSVGLQAYLIALNMYDGGGAATVWSTQVKFDAAAGVLEAQWSGHTTPLITDRWVEWRAEIDTASDEYDLYYDGVLWAEGLSWVPGIGGPGIADLQAIDLYLHWLDSGPGMFIDDVLVSDAGHTPRPTCGDPCFSGCEPCETDCDGSGSLDFFDFLCFQNLFAAADPQADCDEDGVLTFFDFLCFQTAFAAGCP